MFVNEDNKYTSEADYFYNEYIDMYCIVGTTFSSQDLQELVEMFESVELLNKIPMPGYITEDYDEPEW